jgi:CRP/FNR family transcriptional regulator, cyclic AMP receptor protein
VDSGRVKITRVAHDGGETVLCVRLPGQFFCPVTLFDNGPQLGTAVAMGEVRLLSAGGQEFEQILQDCPELSAEIQRECLVEVRTLMHRLERAGTRNLPRRVAATLLTQAQQLSRLGETPDIIRLTHQDIAGLTGASREAISRSLGKLARDGLIQTGRAEIRLLRPDRLRRLAGDLEE